jgi:hypothetical protein
MGRLLAKTESVTEAQRSEAERAFDAVRAELEAVSEKDRQAPNVDLQEAALVTLTLAERVASPALAERVAKQVKVGEFDAATLERAKRLAWACIHLRRKLVLRAETRSDAKVTPSLAEQSEVLVERMRRLCEYYFDDDPELGPVLAQLRLGSGYLDRANDLEEYAEIYRERRAELSADRKLYRSTDEAEARRLSRELFRALGVDEPHTPDWNALQSAAWPMLSSLYQQLRRIGVYLSGGDDRDWPTLVSAVRSNARRSTSSAPSQRTPAPTPTPVDGEPR